MIEMLCIEHQLIIYKEMNARFRDFEQLDKVHPIRTTPREFNEAIPRKTRAQVKSYLEQSKTAKKLKAQNALNEHTLPLKQ